MTNHTLSHERFISNSRSVIAGLRLNRLEFVDHTWAQICIVCCIGCSGAVVDRFGFWQDVISLIPSTDIFGSERGEERFRIRMESKFWRNSRWFHASCRHTFFTSKSSYVVPLGSHMIKNLEDSF